MIGALVAVLVIAVLLVMRTGEGFVAGLISPNCGDAACKDCGVEFDGQLWKHWGGEAMPWRKCYYKDKDGRVKPVPYCSMWVQRQPGGVIGPSLFSKCGTRCLSNSECPAACPKCHAGTCQSGFKTEW